MGFDARVRRPRVRVAGLGSYVPSEVITNHDLAKMMNTSDEWIKTRTGISERRRASVEEGTSDLATKACEKALQAAQIRAQDVDLIVTATVSPDYCMPGIGVLVQHKLGCRPVLALDVRGQCAGFTWALATADAYAQLQDLRYILVVGAEVQTRILDFSDAGRDTAVLFGDGAGAVLLEVERSGSSDAEMPSVSNRVSGLIDHELGSDGSGCQALYVPRPGMLAGHERYMTAGEIAQTVPQMDGRYVFKNAVNILEQVTRKILDRHGLEAKEVDLLVPHQANLRINEVLRDRLGLSSEQVVNTIHKYGNTTAATIPLCFQEAYLDGRLQPGALVLTVAFGSGFSWGANLLRW